MAIPRHREVAGSEAAAFEKLARGLAWAIEAATEIGMNRGDQSWMRIAILLQQMQKKTDQLKIIGRVNQQQANGMIIKT